MMLRLLVLIALAYFLYPAFVSAHDKHVQISPQMHQWFKSLRSDGGTNCCDLYDGNTLADPDWRSNGENYEVKVDNRWLPVPDHALIKRPNMYGPAVVWLGKEFQEDKTLKVIVRCFIPGAGT